MIDCKDKCVKDPSGLWEFENMIGAKVTIKSMPIGNFFKMTSTSKVYTIKNIYFRVSLDGKVITNIELDGEEYEGIYFNWKDLIIQDVNKITKPIVDRVNSSCGTITC